MNESNSMELYSIQTLRDQTKFRVAKINNIKDYFSSEIQERKTISKKLSKYIAAFVLYYIILYYIILYYIILHYIILFYIILYCIILYYIILYYIILYYFFYYIGKTLIFLSATSGGISIISFASVIGVPTGLASASFTLVFLYQQE